MTDWSRPLRLRPLVAATDHQDQLPDAARCVIVGGGVGGASIAYHLARLGWEDVVVVEQHDLTEGTTWHSAGFVGQLRSTITETRMIMYSSGLYRELRDVTARDPGWREVGGLRIATTPERVEELQRQASAADTYGLALELLSPTETRDRLPLLAVDDVLGAAWLPGDGYLDPALLALALAEGARGHGVRFCTHTRVTGIAADGGRVTAVETDRGTIRAEVVVDAAGAGQRAVGGHVVRLELEGALEVVLGGPRVAHLEVRHPAQEERRGVVAPRLDGLVEEGQRRRGVTGGQRLGAPAQHPQDDQVGLSRLGLGPQLVARRGL